jgi:amino acid transporter
VINFWSGAQGINSGVWIAVFLVVICSFNFLGVRAYGEAEFWFSLTKIVTIVGLIILGIVITAGGAPNHEAIGFRYW